MVTYIKIFDAKVDEIMRGELAKLAVRHARDEALEAAKNATPVRSGRHRDAIQALEGEDVVDGKAAAWYGSTSPTWHILEFGTATTPAARSMTHGVEAVGLKWTAEPAGTDPAT